MAPATREFRIPCVDAAGALAMRTHLVEVCSIGATVDTDAAGEARIVVVPVKYRDQAQRVADIGFANPKWVDHAAYVAALATIVKDFATDQAPDPGEDAGRTRTGHVTHRAGAGGPDRPDLNAAAILAEYAALKTEQTARIGSRDGLTYATLAAVAFVALAAYQTDTPLLLLAIPPACAILGWLRLINDVKITDIGWHVAEELAPNMRAITGQHAFVWDTSVRFADPERRRRRKLIDLIFTLATFVGPAAVAIVVQSIAGPSLAGGILAGLGLVAVISVAGQIVHHADMASR